jgi:hypothetical protein
MNFDLKFRSYASSEILTSAQRKAEVGISCTAASQENVLDAPAMQHYITRSSSNFAQIAKSDTDL